MTLNDHLVSSIFYVRFMRFMRVIFIEQVRVETEQGDSENEDEISQRFIDGDFFTF